MTNFWVAVPTCSVLVESPFSLVLAVPDLLNQSAAQLG
jgi:hypothetical protein